MINHDVLASHMADAIGTRLHFEDMCPHSRANWRKVAERFEATLKEGGYEIATKGPSTNTEEKK